MSLGFNIEEFLLRQNSLHYLTMHICQPIPSSLMPEGQTLMVDAQ